ncbi:astacin-like [Bacillus rossius redtenbacheri]|uniref:astacin-like n=1 Tax=Bacillus rossius redtenbacheri TaxID=93214 RepID=UPI002FDDF063
MATVTLKLVTRYKSALKHRRQAVGQEAVYKLEARSCRLSVETQQLKMALVSALVVAMLAAAATGQFQPRPATEDVPPFPPNGPPASSKLTAGRLFLGGDLSEAQKKQHAWERSGQFEGDIVFPNGLRPANGIIFESWKWNSLQVPYFIDPLFTRAQRAVILGAIDEYHRRTCIRFRPYVRTDPDYVYITGNFSGCYSYIGRVANGQILNLEYNGGCVFHDTVLHELLHALGFYHMQSTSKRDNHVTILWDNIMTGFEHNFEIYNTTDFGTPYDYISTMHYSRFAFSSNGQPTIESKQGHSSLGTAKNLTDLDIFKLHTLYGCRT